MPALLSSFPVPSWLASSARPTLAAVAVAFISLIVPLPAGATDVGGDILVNTLWDPSGSPYVVVDTVIVRGGATLTISPGVVVRLDPNESIIAHDSAIIANGTPDSTILFTNNQGTVWASVIAFGSQASLSLKHCVVEYGSQLQYNTGQGDPVLFRALVGHAFATTVVEDSELRFGTWDAVNFSAGSINFRRNFVHDMFRQGYNSDQQATGTVEDNRLENIGGDAFDITAPNGQEVAFRNNMVIDVGDDGLDIDDVPVQATFSFFEVYNVADKGITVSKNSRNCLVENMIVVGSRGEQDPGRSAAYTVSRNSDLSIFNSVAYDSRVGFSAYTGETFAGANMTVENSITWATHESPVFVDAASTMTIIYSITDTPQPYPGLGNLNSNPRFIDPANNNFRLAYNSPAIDAGWSDGTPPVDIRGNPRVDDPNTPDTGGPPPITYYDIGAHEFDPSTAGADPAPGSPPLGFRLRVYPSPASSPVSIGFQLPDRRDVEVGVYDPAGRLVERVFRGALGAGPHILPLPGHGGTNGIYFIRLRAGDEVAVEKLVRVR